MENKNTKIFEGLDSELDFETVSNDLKTLFSSPNPFAIYLNAKNIKDKFSAFMVNLSRKISDGFQINGEGSKTFMMSIYKNCSYDKVWVEYLENYLRESKNFDLLSYLFYVKTFTKNKQYLAKSLLKMYQNRDKDLNTQKEIINNFLPNTKINLSFDDVQKIFNNYKIGNIEFDINLREDFVEHFIEKIYLSLPSQEASMFLDNFILKIDKSNTDFNDVVKILLKIISSYVKEDKYGDLDEIVNSPYFAEVKDNIDNLLKNYKSLRGQFYSKVSYILNALDKPERASFWQYIKTYIIDEYYPNIKLLFYEYSSNTFIDKDNYTRLKGNFKVMPSVSPESEYFYSECNEIIALKNIILALNENIFSFFLLPVVYYTISEKIIILKSDLYKMKYLLLYIFSQNYAEYKKVYKFFNQLETFLNYERKSNVIEKIKVSFSIILFTLIVLTLCYFYLPAGIFLGIFLLAAIKYFEVIYPNFYFSQKWNVGLKFFAIVFLCVSSFFYFQNTDKLVSQKEDLTKKLEVLGTMSSRDVFENGVEFVKASILDIKK